MSHWTSFSERNRNVIICEEEEDEEGMVAEILEKKKKKRKSSESEIVENFLLINSTVCWHIAYVYNIYLNKTNHLTENAAG